MKAGDSVSGYVKFKPWECVLPLLPSLLLAALPGMRVFGLFPYKNSGQ